MIFFWFTHTWYMGPEPFVLALPLALAVHFRRLLLEACERVRRIVSQKPATLGALPVLRTLRLHTNAGGEQPQESM